MAEPKRNWVAPVRGRILSKGGRLFGERDGKHMGVDIHAAKGTPVRAVARGVVSHSDVADISGEWVGVRHPDGTTTRYHHLSRRKARAGEAVQAGQVIGLVGDTGRSGSGPHLHIEHRRTQSSGHPSRWPALDPAASLPGTVRPGCTYPDGKRHDDSLPGPDAEEDGPPATDGRIVLAPGDRGVDVYTLQCLLRAESHDSTSLGSPDTAHYRPGGETLAAVHSAARRLRGHANPSPEYRVGPAMIAALADSIRSSVQRSLNLGDTGNDAYRLQHVLEAYKPGILQGPLGGWDTAAYDPRTVQATRQAVREVGLFDNPRRDYTAGPRTFEALLTAVLTRWGG